MESQRETSSGVTPLCSLLLPDQRTRANRAFEIAYPETGQLDSFTHDLDGEVTRPEMKCPVAQSSPR